MSLEGEEDTRADKFFAQGEEDGLSETDPLTDDEFEYHADYMNYKSGYKLGCMKQKAFTNPDKSFDALIELAKPHPTPMDAKKRCADAAPKDGAVRNNSGKPRVDYIPMRALFDAYSMTILDGDPLAVIAEKIAEFEAGRDDAIYYALGLLIANDKTKDICDVFEFGAKKYAKWNWTKGMSWSSVLASLKRHWLSLASGNEIDAESGLSEWGHLGCNVVMLVHYTRHYREGDDRPPAEIFTSEVTK